MGYYSRFNNEDLTDEQIEKLVEISDYCKWTVTGNEDAKWYDFEEDVKKFSKLYPNQLFRWDIEGEESGDIWRAYFKNGKSCEQKPTITFPEFTEDLLQ